MLLCLAPVDFKKTLDSVSHSVVMQDLVKHGIDMAYIRVLHHIYETSSAFVSTKELIKDFSIKKSVKQGDPVSPELFSAVKFGKLGN